MDDKFAARFYEDNLLVRLKRAEDNIALLQKLGIALQTIDNRVCSFDTKIGLVLSNNGSDANNDIDIAAGYCRNSADTENIVSTTAATKQLDAAWAAGTGAGGLFSGSKANSTWYHVFVIMDANGGIDWGFDTSVTAANKPTDYIYHRRIGSIRTNSSGNIIAFKEYASRVMWTASVLDLNGGNQTSPTSFTATVPPGLKVCAIGNGQNGSAGNAIYIFDPDNASANFVSAYGAGSVVVPGNQNILSNASSQLRYYVSGGVGSWYTYGWEELWQI